MRYRCKLLSAQCLTWRKIYKLPYIIFFGEVARSLLIGLLGEGKLGKGLMKAKKGIPAGHLPMTMVRVISDTKLLQ